MKSPDEAVENYVASVPIAMWKNKKYLMRDKKFKEDYAIEQSLHYGKKMLLASVGGPVPPELAASLFREIAIISNTMADWLDPRSN